MLRLRRQKLNTEPKFEALPIDLEKMVMKNVREIARSLNVKLLLGKASWLDVLVSKCRLRSLPDEYSTVESLEDDVRETLASLPSFSESCRDGWTKTLDGALDSHHVVHLH